MTAKSAKSRKTTGAARAAKAGKAARATASARAPAPYVAGAHPETSALMNALASAGVTAPHTGKPYTEGMLLGVGGGLAFNYHTFQYKGWTPTLYVSGRYLLQDNVAFLQGACERLGVDTEVREATGPNAAEKKLAEALESGPAVAWVDLASFAYSGLPPFLQRMMYYVVYVAGVDAGRGVASVGDTLCPKLIEVATGELTQARGAIPAQKNRLLSVTAPGASITVKDLEKAIREGIQLFAGTANKARTWNNRLDGIGRWAELLTSDTKEGWPSIFVPGAPLLMGLGRAYTWIELFGTGGGLMRGLYADFLDEAGQVLKLRPLGEVAGRYRELAKQWTRFARSCLPDGVPLLKEVRSLLDQHVKALAQKGAAAQPELQKGLERLRAIRRSMEEKFPLDDPGVRELLARLQGQLSAIAQGETEAVEALRAAVSK